MPCSHWSKGFGWLMVEHIYNSVKDKHKSMIEKVSFLALIADEFTSVDNTSWIAVHLYIVWD